MHSFGITFLVLLASLAGAWGGTRLQRILPQTHLCKATQEVVTLSMGLIATMTALVLGLLLASAQNSYDLEDAAVRRCAADLLLLDRMLTAYGSEADSTRELIRKTVETRIAQLWPKQNGPAMLLVGNEETKSRHHAFSSLRELKAQTPEQQWYQSKALDIATEIMRTRWWAVTSAHSDIPLPFMAALVFWLVILFASFALFAPQNPTVTAMFFLSALSVSIAVFLMVELGEPFHGWLRISPAPLEVVVEQMQR